VTLPKKYIDQLFGLLSAHSDESYRTLEVLHSHGAYGAGDNIWGKVDAIEADIRRLVEDVAAEVVAERCVVTQVVRRECEQWRSIAEDIMGCTVYPDTASIMPAAMSHMKASAFADYVKRQVGAWLAALPPTTPEVSGAKL
jgi:hypothetical protein